MLGALVWLPLVGGAAEPGPTRLTAELERRGFHVTPGGVEVWNRGEAWCRYAPDIDHAWYNNNAPYLVLKVPRAAGSAELVQDFKLRPDEAIVLVGTTPPPERYFAFYAWIASKVYPDGQRLPGLMVAPTDPVNHLSIKTEGPPGDPFGKRVALVFTPDRGTYRSVLQALGDVGYSTDAVNQVVFPASMLNLGDGDAADDFRIQMRNAMWEDGYENAGEAYIRNAPLRMFRVTPRVPVDEGDLDPFPLPGLRIRGTGQSEVYLWNTLGVLRQRILDANPGMDAKDVPVTVPVGYEGMDDLQRAVPVGGDARDAFCLQAGYLPEFLSWDDQITLGDGEFLMAFGANHAATGKTSYMSINVYTGEAKDGKLSIGTVDDRKLSGTAARFLPPGDPAAGLMYAYKISRSCGGEANCLQVPSEDLVKKCRRLDVGPDTVLGLLYRMYLEPATKSGAAMQEVLYDRLIKFSPGKAAP
ncbi:hypothetical protein [Anaeromyxobacter dehalogenans]|uniref:hypothetical protein n=1 Tax=Anaeromyxobacter dehalogenans TaxID=161493 RepID=UPI001E55FF19|nr:hypothetical protein [Anaeromyxobacter dehalogenans]